MRHSRIPRDASSVSLFPFLAVLLCTMGSLIVILVVLSHQARVQAAQKTAPPEEDQDLVQAKENLAWELEQLAQSREGTARDLARERLALSHLEDHLRRLREKAQRLAAAARELARADEATDAQRREKEAELARLDAQIDEARRLVEAQRAKVAENKRSYAIIPYQGPNKTTRRPLFIECRADSVVLQPEGVVLQPPDFEEPLGPRNPLASAIRAASEYLLLQGGRGDAEPYPLLLVRPSGISAYYRARAALESWGADFGYELVGEDWKLEYPPVDPRLAELQRRAVEEGRIYQQRLAQMAPSKYGKGRPVYRAAPHRGGFIREGGNGGEARYEKGDGGPDNESQPESRPSRDAGQAEYAGEAKPELGEGAGEAGGNLENVLQARQAGARGGQNFKGRGDNWALPDAARGAVAISRPVRAIVRQDRLVLLYDQRAGEGRVVKLGERTSDAIDEFVSALWEHMDSWGIAGNGLYWRPVLVLQVGPEAHGRAADLRVLLRRSGIEFSDDQGDPR